MSSTQKPNFLILGAAKTGTTSIHAYMEQHPDIFMPRKETFYFISELFKNNHLPYPKQRPAEEIVFAEADYLNPFSAATGEKIRAEVATGYLFYHEKAIPRIKAELGEDVKLLAVLRNPVSRSWSGYTFFSRDLHEKLSWEDAIAAEKQRTAEDWDFMWHYVEHSKYAASVKAYQEAFPNFKVMLFDDLTKDPAAFMAELFEYLEIDSKIDLDLEMKNVSGAPKSKAFQTLITQDNPIKKILRPVLRTLFGRETRHKMRQYLKSKNVGDKDSMTAEQYNSLLPQFTEDINQLEKLIGRDLSAWKKAKSE
jgi:hypothetical protein